MRKDNNFLGMTGFVLLVGIYILVSVIGSLVIHPIKTIRVIGEIARNGL